MDRPGSGPSHRHPTAALLAALLGLALIGCGGGGGPAPTGTRLPLPTDAGGGTLQPGATLPTPGTIGTPVNVPWPSGWDAALCATFGQLVEVQELAVDIGRALDEDARDDARGLTAELAQSAQAARALLDGLPPWEADEQLRAGISELLDLADEMAFRYDRHLNQNRRPALAVAQEAGRQMRGVVDPILERLTVLAEQGLRCPGLTFNLETPADP